MDGNIAACPPVERTTKGFIDDCYEHLLSAHASLSQVIGCIYGEDTPDVTNLCQPGIHGGAIENARLAASLRERLDILYGKL